MMNWGTTLLAVIPEEEKYTMRSWPEFLMRYPFFSTAISPRGHAYLINRLVGINGLRLLRSEAFGQYLEGLSRRILEGIGAQGASPGTGHPVHRLDLDRDFLDFLRLSAGIKRIHRQEALYIKEMVDHELELG